LRHQAVLAGRYGETDRVYLGDGERFDDEPSGGLVDGVPSDVGGSVACGLAEPNTSVL
jgi:hypothetical protein